MPSPICRSKFPIRRRPLLIEANDMGGKGSSCCAIERWLDGKIFGVYRVCIGSRWRHGYGSAAKSNTRNPRVSWGDTILNQPADGVALPLQNLFDTRRLWRRDFRPLDSGMIDNRPSHYVAEQVDEVASILSKRAGARKKQQDANECEPLRPGKPPAHSRSWLVTIIKADIHRFHSSAIFEARASSPPLPRHPRCTPWQ
jgi:hypothetical protein